MHARELRISLVRLAVGTVGGFVLQVALAVVIGRVEFWVLSLAVVLAVVINTSAVPNVAARSSVLMVLASCGLCVFAAWLTFNHSGTAEALVPRPVAPCGRFRFGSFPLCLGDMMHPLAAVFSGFTGGTLFALIAHFLIFRTFAPFAALAVGALTVPSGLVLSDERSWVLHGVVWYLLFLAGFGASAAVHGRVVWRRNGVVSEWRRNEQ